MTDQNAKTLFMRIRERLQGQYAGLFAVLALDLCMVVPGLLVPIFSQIFIDDILLGNNEGWLVPLLLFMAGTLLFKGLLYRRWNILIGLVRRKMAILSAHNFLHHLFRLPLDFYDRRFIGDLVNRLDNNNAVSTFLVKQLLGAASNILVALFYLGVLLYYSPRLTAVGLVITLFNLIAIKLVSDSMAPVAIRIQDDGANLNGVLYAGLRAIGMIKASGAESDYVGRLLGKYAALAQDEQELGTRQRVLDVVPEISSQFVSVVTLILGAMLVVRGEMTPGMLVAYVSLLGSFIKPLNALAGFASAFQLFKADLACADDILDETADARFADVEKDPRTDRLTGEVTIDHVTFGFNAQEAPLIRDLCLHLEPGRSVALVGNSGSGKSTVARLVTGLYQPWSGEIRMDGIPRNRIRQDVFVGSVSAINRNGAIFSGSIRDNLTFWNEEIPEADVIRAAKDACLHETVTRKPGAYDYRLLENGANLSGGERQRLVIARALVTNPRILVMDEATGALDPVIEQQILENIKRRGCTCIVVAHRLSAIRDCDEILVMNDGQILQRGTHDALAAVDGPYRQLIQNN